MNTFSESPVFAGVCRRPGQKPNMIASRRSRRVRWPKTLAACMMVAALAPVAAYSQNAVIYEGARLIIGDASSPIENGAFVVQNGHITAIGAKGSIKAPSGASRVDLTGKTVMPTMNNVHIHAGYEGFVSWSAENLSAENMLDHMEREAFYGVGAAETMGDQPDAFAIKFQQDQIAGKFPPAARFFFCCRRSAPGRGAGLAPDSRDHPKTCSSRSCDAGGGYRRGSAVGGREDYSTQDLGRQAGQ